jgi:hypothetical protein
MVNGTEYYRRELGGVVWKQLRRGYFVEVTELGSLLNAHFNLQYVFTTADWTMCLHVEEVRKFKLSTRTTNRY